MAEPAQNYDHTGAYLENETYDEPANINDAPTTRVSGVKKEYRKKGSGSNTVATTGQIGGAAMQGTGSIVQGAGKTVRGVSKAVMRVPIVGPVVGGVGVVAGTGVEQAGKGIKKTGRTMRRTSAQYKRGRRSTDILEKTSPQAQQRRVARRLLGGEGVRERRNRVANIDAPPSKAELKSRLRLPSIILRVSAYFFSFLTAIFNFLFIAFSYAYYLLDAGESLIEFLGADLSLGADTVLGWVALSLILSFVIPCIFVFIAYRVMSGKGAEPRNTAIKEGLFLTGFVMCFVPIANMYPWINRWIAHVAKHPE